MNNRVELDERDMFSISDDEKKQKAREFAEGNVWLEELLLFLWNHNATTYACCGGHKGDLVEIDGEVFEDESNPYVLIGIENMSDTELQTILGMLCKNEEVFLLEVNNDKLDTEGSRYRKYIDIHLVDASSSMKDVAAVFFGAMEEGFVSDNSELSEGDREFIESAVALKNTNIEELDLSDFKSHYKHFPEKVSKILITRNKSGKPKYDVKLRDGHVLLVDSNGICFVCSRAFYRGAKGDTFVVDENADVVSISSEQIKKLGLIESKEYISMIHELFEKDQSAIMKLLSSKAEEEKQKQ